MFKLECDKCREGYLCIDRNLTLEDYKNNIDFEIAYEGTLKINKIPIYMYYVCNRCNSLYKLTPVEVEDKIRDFMANIALKMKRAYIMEQINFKEVDPDNGIEFCGKCVGYDGKGTCLKDIIKQCPLLKETKA